MRAVRAPTLPVCALHTPVARGKPRQSAVTPQPVLPLLPPPITPSLLVLSRALSHSLSLPLSLSPSPSPSRAPSLSLSLSLSLFLSLSISFCDAGRRRRRGRARAPLRAAAHRLPSGLRGAPSPSRLPEAWLPSGSSLVLAIHVKSGVGLSQQALAKPRPRLARPPASGVGGKGRGRDSAAAKGGGEGEGFAAKGRGEARHRTA